MVLAVADVAAAAAAGAAAAAYMHIVAGKQLRTSVGL